MVVRRARQLQNPRRQANSPDRGGSEQHVSPSSALHERLPGGWTGWESAN